MTDIIYRPLEKKDFSDITQLIDDAWNFDNYIKNKKCKYHCIRAFMLGTILGQNYTQVAEMDNEVVGLIFGKVPKLKGFVKNFRHIPAALYHGYMCYRYKEDRNMIKSFQGLLKVYKELLNKSGEEFGGELEFFIVHSKARGKSIGKTLWQNYKKFCKENGVKKIYVYTDDKCNFGFYDHNGFERKFSMPTTFDTYKGKDTFNVYFYTKTLQD
ncbi:MAG: GNAT family N-acetyltransferase [Bacillota bacterium]